jgi:hypothetical protein
MTATIEAPVEWVESLCELRFPQRIDRRFQELMHCNNEGALSESERLLLESLVELSERLSLIRAEALNLLGRNPG